MKIGDMIEIYCGNNHEELQKMEIREGCEGRDNFFVCPKYMKYDKEKGEKPCMNNLSFRDYCEILEKIEKMLEENDPFSGRTNFTNYKFRVGPNGGYKTDCKIIEHSESKIKIMILNRKILT